jgi:hypothetical protein
MAPPATSGIAAAALTTISAAREERLSEKVSGTETTTATVMARPDGQREEAPGDPRREGLSPRGTRRRRRASRA